MSLVSKLLFEARRFEGSQRERRLLVATSSALVLAAAVAVTLAVVVHAGIPAFRHDWQWPSERRLLAALFWRKLDPWSWDGLGHPNVAIQVHPYFAVTAALSAFLSSKAILAGWFAFTALASAVGLARYLVQRWDCDVLSAAVAGVCYAAGPVVVTKTVAGHLAYLVAYAALPWVLAVPRERRTAVGVDAFALAWTGLQLQVFVVALPVWLWQRRKHGVRATLLGLLLAGSTLGTFLFSLLAPDTASIREEMRTSIPWEMNQSSDVVSAVAGLGYFARYWEHAVRGLPMSVAIPWLTAASVLVAVRLRGWKAAGILALSYAFGVLIISGLRGPLAPLFAALFIHVAAFSAFRELYHFAVVTALAGCVALALVLNAVRPLPRVICAVAIAFAVLQPWVAGRVLGQTGSARSESRAWEAAAGGASAPRRIALAPLANPVNDTGAAFGGAEPNAYQDASALPFWVYLPRGFEGTAVFALEQGDSDSFDRLADVLGIDAILNRRGFEAKLRNSARYPPRIVDGRFATIEPRSWRRSFDDGTYRVLRSPHANGIVRIVRDPPPLAIPHPDRMPFSVEHGADVNAGWAQAIDYWYVNAATAEAVNGVVSEAAPPPALRAACPRASASPFYTGTAAWAAGPECDGVPLAAFRSRGIETVTPGDDVLRWANLLRIAGRSTVANESSLRGDEITVTATADCARCLVLLAESCARGWRLVSSGETHAAAVRSATGLCEWRVNVRRRERFTLTYAPSRLTYALEALSAVAFVILAVFAIRSPTGSSTRRR